MDKGVRFALITAVISGISVYLNSIGVSYGDAFVYTTIKNTLVGVFLLSSLFLFGRLNELKKLTVGEWKKLAIIGIVGGSIPFLLFFYGLSIGTAASGSFIYRFLFAAAAVLGITWLKEKLDVKYLIGAALLLIGNFLLFKGTFVFGLGEALVLLATIIWAFEYGYSKKALATISPDTVAFGRMAFGSIILIGFIAATGKMEQLFAPKPLALEWAVIASVLLCGFVMSWYRALKDTTLSKATAVLVLGGPITMILGFIFAGKIITSIEQIGLFAIILGVYLVMMEKQGILGLFKNQKRDYLYSIQKEKEN